MALSYFCIFQAASVTLAVGSLVWVEDPNDVWIDGEVVEIKGENLKVVCTSGKTVSSDLPCLMT